MKKIIKLLGLLPLLLLSGCKEKNIYVSAEITQKYHYITIILAGPSNPVPIDHYDFIFNQAKPYRKEVSWTIYNQYEIGDIYTFCIDENEKEYFFENSIYIGEINK